MTLDEVVKMVLDVQLREADPDHDLAMLHMADCQFDEKGEPLRPPGMILTGLSVGPGVVIAAVARLMIATCEPSVAVLALPSWSAKLPPGQTLKTYGVTQVRDLPADLVQDSLVVYGEDVGGASVMRMYTIERDAQGARVWVKQPPAPIEESRFKGLFVLPEMLKLAMPFAGAFGLANEWRGTAPSGPRCACSPRRPTTS